MSDVLSCPEGAALERFLLGQLPLDEIDLLARHVEQCSRCVEALTTVEARDALVETMQTSAQAVEEQPSTVLAALLERLSHAAAQDRYAFLALPQGPGLSRPMRQEGSSRVPSPAGYEILGELGRGGMGVVYKARQLSVDRLVALKMIRTGAHASEQELARLRREAEAVARLQHPHIVQIYEVGEVDGMPFLSLEYVEGGTLAQQIGGAPQPGRQAAALVRTLAAAMHSAHQRGVIHRDLKPANILLQTVVSGQWPVASKDKKNPSSSLTTDHWPLTTVPKIADFGLAKRLEVKGLTGSEGAVLGTPAYMAPEQALGRSGEQGALVDVYALGAILYEMLTGRPPFLGESTLDTLAQVLAADPLPPTQLAPRVEHDLETICLKCLHKDPHRRYLSADELAQDLARFLDGEPIRARPTPAWERGVKWARRRPALAALLGVSGLAVVVVLALVLAFNARLRQERDTAERRREEAETNFQEAQTQRRRALAYLRQAHDAVDQLLTRVGSERLAGVPQTEALQRELLQDALRFAEALAKEDSSDPDLRHEIARANRRLGKLHFWFQQQDQAEACFRAALAHEQQLVAQFPDVPAYRQELAANYNHLGKVLRDKDQPTEAADVLRQARQLQEKLLADDPAEPSYRLELTDTWNVLGTLHARAGDAAEEEKAYRKGIELIEDLLARFPTVSEYQLKRVGLRSNLGALMEDQRRFEEAEAIFRQNRDFWEDLYRREPSSLQARSKVAYENAQLGHLLANSGRVDEAETAYRRVTELRELLARDFPSVPYYHHALSEGLQQLALLVERRGDRDEARRLFEGAVSHHQAALKLVSGSAEYLSGLRDNAGALAELLLKMREHREAARLVAELAPVFADSGRDGFAAGAVLARCAALAANDDRVGAEERQAAARTYADQAIQRLRAAIAKGWRDVAFLRNDPGLESLRTRPDFQELVQSLAEGDAAKPR